nr:cell envelope integrity protein TolA [Mesorhizobium loti]
MADYVHGQLARCWNVPAGTIGAGGVTIRFKLDRKGFLIGAPELAGHEADVRIELDENGTVTGNPRIVATPQDKVRATLIRSAITAIQKCSTFPGLVKLAPYDSWKEIAVTFKPPELR